MITQIRIENFKCLRSAELAIAPLTVLTGLNGSGKSSVIQSLLLARMATQAGVGGAVLLNGPFELSLGSAQDVLSWDASSSTITIGISEPGGNSSAFRLSVPEDLSALYLTVSAMEGSKEFGALNGSPASFTYLSAERFGPRDLLALGANAPEDIGVGVRGEFTAQVLALRETRAVDDRALVRERLWHPSADTPVLRLQAEAWMSEVVRPIRISARYAPGILASVVRFTEPDGDLSDIRPMNTGFGVSYTLPIIVAGLLSLPGDCLVVENPEAHIHPRGQSRLGHFLGLVAASGVQVVVETHSDHVLNGVRLAIASRQSITSEEAVVHFFGAESPQTIGITERGELSGWPEGFFDQMDLDLEGLSRARRAPAR